MLKKIKGQAELAKKKRLNQIIIGIFMIGILVFSSLGYSLISSDRDEKDSIVNEFGVEFFKQGGLWKIVVGEDVFGFQNLPSEISDIDVNVSLDFETYSGQPLYFVNPSEGMSEILNNIGQFILRYQESCLQQNSGVGDLEFGIDEEESGIDCKGDLPMKDCRSNLIIFEDGNKTRVYQNENCIYIVGDGVKGADAFLYKILGVN